MLVDVITPAPDVLAPLRARFTLIGGVLVVAGVAVLIGWLRHTFWGRVPTVGTVVATTTTYGHHRAKSGTRITVRYAVGDETCEIESDRMFGSWHEGEPVTVRYLPGMPSDGIVAAAFFVLVAAFLCVLGGVFIVAAHTVDAH